MGSLKSFITSVRKAKTIADERAAIRKESAAIRSSIRDTSIDERSRRTLIAKLIYLYILGEPTHFGQVECLKLLATQSFTSKRLGYLATMLILDENQEVLTLLTNSLDNDLQHSNQLFVGLALVTLGNIASTELARDLYTNVSRLVQSSNPYIRKKAIMVAAKLIQKDPDLTEFFIELVPSLLTSAKTHGEWLASLALVKSCYELGADRQLLRAQVPQLLTQLTSLRTTGFSPEYDVAGVPDPFLFVSLLQTLRVLMADDYSDEKNIDRLTDLLTQIASKVETLKNAPNAVLYEVVKTIFEIQSDSSLKILGVNVLGKFLGSKDNNSRYVALNTLLTVVQHEPKAVQRHRATVVACLRDQDISIRRRALELSFAILDKNNIRVMIKELILFLHTAETDLKPYLTGQLTLAIERYSPSERWEFETLISILSVSGNFFEFDIVSSILGIIMRCSDGELVRWVTQQLFEESLKTQDQFALNLICCWCLGEYGESIFGSVSPEKIVSLLQTLLVESHYEDKSNTEQLVKYGLMASLKLSVKLQQYPQLVESLRQLIASKANDINLEIQIRAIEYGEIFVQPLDVKKGLLEKMPAPAFKSHKGASLSTAVPQKKAVAKQEPDLLDLLGDDIPQEAVKPSTETLDLISGLFSAPIAPIAPVAVSEPDVEPVVEYTDAFHDSNVHVSFRIKSSEPGHAVLESRITNTSIGVVSQISMLVAVTKSLKLQLLPMTGTSIGPGDSVYQQLSVSGKQGAKIKLRVKLSYENVAPVETQFDFAGLGQTL
ncbi:unnamed protein product [Kuraishia capsulata CBS 1993]|uniref:AP-1 complex subunit gamma n=1 Tax=Kuraishia capsulata CBS 1993 TaxID=1382522 RepID=W6MRM3_9ASCO|nr:uncharacterized protein KUCA_T00003877001 [Kuraishia capsulata CBS 1993]CDK27897.1 unnamed protein product [Kuraishia capsulata CBS 1993]